MMTMNAKTTRLFAIAACLMAAQSARGGDVIGIREKPSGLKQIGDGRPSRPSTRSTPPTRRYQPRPATTRAQPARDTRQEEEPNPHLRQPPYERENEFWSKRYKEVFREKQTEFAAPRIGDHIAITLRIGGQKTGVISAISSSSVTINRTRHDRKSIGPESCQQLFAQDWAAAEAKRIVLQEKEEYEGAEDAKWEVRKKEIIREGDAVAAAMATARAEETYENALAILAEAIKQHPEAWNLAEAEAYHSRLLSGRENAIQRQQEQQRLAALAAQAFSSRDNFALYFLNRVGNAYQFRNPHTGGLNTVQGRVRSSDVTLYQETARVEFEIVNSHNDQPVGRTRFTLRFVKNFGAWEFDTYTCSDELAWSDGYVRYLIQGLGL